jgi:NAD+ synthetase
MMPSRYTLDISREDARAVSGALGARYSEIPIDGLFDTYLRALRHEFAGRAADTAEENLQSRIRATLLMAIANKTRALVLTAGNKSELATGYAALYGDMAGGFAVLKDIAKTLVYRLARYRNGIARVIPDRVFQRPPSAELRPDQVDRDSLPPYPLVDAILDAYVEEDMSPADIVSHGIARSDVDHVVGLVRASEFKRRQAPVGVRITTRGFGKDWRYPITNRFRE